MDRSIPLKDFAEDYDGGAMMASEQKKEGMGALAGGVVVFLVAFLVFSGLKPEWTMKRDDSGQPTDVIDYWRVFFGAAMLAVLLGLAVWAFSGPKSSNKKW